MSNPRNNPKLSGITNKEQREVVRSARKLGARVTMTKGTHIKIEYNDQTVFLPLTSSSSSAGHRARRELRKIGLEV